MHVNLKVASKDGGKMKPQTKRVFINNLPDNISQNDLKQKFNHFGLVTTVEIKQRQNVGVSQTARFAYVNLKLDDNSLEDCINEFSNRKWKGHWIQIQEAKESFMERLKREREESKTDNGSVEIAATITHTKQQCESSDNVVEDDFVIKNNNRICREKSKIEAKTDEKLLANGVEANSSDKRGCEAERKRLQSLAQMKESYRHQKLLIKSALANIDCKQNNKIIFHDNDDGINTKPSSKKRKSQVEKPNRKRHKLMLFEEEENNGENENYTFEIKEHLQGKKGQKLMDLQSRFKSDSRFKMDARFLEEDSDDNEKQDVNALIENVEILQENEKQKQIEILEQVLGKKISSQSTKNTDKAKFKMMLRFDPTQPEHFKYEVKEAETHERNRKKQKDSERSDKVDESIVVVEATKPEVSKEKFYKVAVDLKDAFQEKGTFSLANMFSKEIESVEEPGAEVIEETKIIAKKKKPLGHEENPFRYESSSEEDDDVTENASKEATAKPNTKLERTGPVRLWSDTFFFKVDDYRLQEGLDFIKRMEADDQEDFSKLRRNLKEIVRAKVRNNQRNNRPFRRKLGGKKRLRVKRALKH